MRTESETQNTVRMAELKTANSLIANRAALDAAWERDGYWFFRDVLDSKAVARLRATYLKVLADVGAIDDPRATEAIHNGSSLEDFPIARLNRLADDPLYQLDPMKQFVAEPAIHNLFKSLIGDEPVWLPVTEYHATPPAQDRNRNRFNFLHRDATPNPCIPFRICWIPLVEIDEELGGLALTEGLHRPRWTDQPPSPIPNTMPIPQESIPAESWRRSNYRPGDLLVFDNESPHSGLANYSPRRFRLSMDIRLMAASDDLPAMGNVVDIDASSITVEDSGSKRRYGFDGSTHCRTIDSRTVAEHGEISRLFPVGSRVIVSAQNGMARLIRPQR